MVRRTKTAKGQKKKIKKLFKVIAPSAFGKKEVCEIRGSEKDVINRIIRMPLNELDNTASDQLSLYTSVKLRVVEQGKDDVKTEFAGHEIAMSYLRTLTRKGRSVIHEVINVKTKDGKDMILKFLVVTVKKVSKIVKKNLRKELIKLALDYAANNNFDDLVKNMINGSLSKEIGKELNKINPIMHLLVKKSEYKVLV
jgi:small subunit ribosomal protein S3Ae